MSSQIDLTRLIDKTGGYGLRGEEHLQATAALATWHQVETNSFGVITEAEELVIAQVGQSRAEVKLARTGRGHWLAGFDFQNSVGGSGCAPAVWDRIAFREKDDAIRFYADQARAWFLKQSTSTNSCISERAREEATKMIALLKRLIIPAPTQPSLF